MTLYNTHNWNYGDRGTKTCNIQLRLGSKVVWRKDDVAVAWDDSKKSNPKTTVSLPDVKYDIVRIEIVACEGVSGGLAEIEVLRKGKNIALGKPVVASVIYNPDSPHLCAPEMVNDGIVDESKPEAGDGKGYWLLPTNKPGWIEILLSQEVAATNPFKKGDAWIGLAVHTEGPQLAKEFGRVELRIDNVMKDQFEATYLWKAFTQKLESEGKYPITGKVRADSAIVWSGTDNVTGTGSLKGDTLFFKWRQPPFVGENWYVPAEVAAKSKLRFVGTYQIIENGKASFTLTLRPNGSATKSHALSVNGGWLASTDQILVVWTDGWRDILKHQGNEYTKLAFGPGLSISGEPSNTGLAKKTK